MKKRIKKKSPNSPPVAGNSEYQTVRKRVYEIMHETVGLKNVPENASWYDLDVESFELVEFIIAIRQEYEMPISIKELAGLHTMYDMIELITKKRLNAKS